MPQLHSPRVGLRRVEDARLLERYHRERDPADLEALVQRYLPLARHLARRYATDQDRDDLEQIASVGLIKALERFDPDRGRAFSSFAVPTILGELKRSFRDLGWAVRVPRSLQELAAAVDRAVETLTAQHGRTPTTRQIADRLNVSDEQVLEARATATAHRPDSLDVPARVGDPDESPGPMPGADDPGYARVEQTADVDRMLLALGEREELIVRLRFQEDLTQHEIAERLGLSQMQISRVLSKSIQALRDEPPAQSTALIARRNPR